jgi:hypothetical protein
LYGAGDRGNLSDKELSVKRVFVLLATLCLVVLGAGRLEAQQAQSQCLIQSPANGSQVRGQHTVIGTATHADFRWYQMGYAPDPNPDGKWSFFWSSETAVTNGQLGVWDTTQIPDGVYQLILEVHRNDGNNEHCFVGQVRVNNTAPTPTFTAAPLPTAASTPTPLPTPEDTPTVIVEQPPTATPRATPTYSSVDNPTPTPEMTRFSLPIDPASVRTASCRGAQVTILLAVVVAIYFVVRNVAVRSVRKIWKSREVEGFHARRPREY